MPGSASRRRVLREGAPRGEAARRGRPTGASSRRGASSAVTWSATAAPHPVRVRLRAPSFFHMAALPQMVKGWKIGDVVAILGSIDIVLGEMDR